ncbi:hypothetical protein ACLUEY_15755 [Vreelandella aquamarina]
MPNIIASSIDFIVMEFEREGSVYSLIEQGCIDESYLEEIIDSLSRLRSASRRIHDNDNYNMENASTDVSKLLDCMASAEAAISILEFHINQLTKGAGPNPADPGLIKQAKKFVINTLKPWIQSVSKGVWALIQKITSLKSWKISGELDGVAFGLAKSRVEISFG